MTVHAYRGHHFSGRENGLMVIASVQALQELGANLSRIREEPASDREWPVSVASVNLGSMERPYALSFHVEHRSGRPNTNVPTSGTAFWVLVTMLPFAVVGLGTVAKWVIGAF